MPLIASECLLLPLIASNCPRYQVRTETEDFDVAAYSEWISQPEMVAKIDAFETARKAGEASIDWSEPQPNPVVQALGNLMAAASAMFGGGADADDIGEATPVPAPCSANIWKIQVSPGQVVAAGDAVVVLEAMKMEYNVNAPCAGTVKAIRVKQGAQVKQGAMLLAIEPAA